MPEGVYLTKDLRTLSLADNGLTEFPADLCRRLQHLVHLDLSRNKLAALPPQFRRLDGLVVLNLAYNPLENWTLYSVFALANVRQARRWCSERGPRMAHAGPARAG